VINETKVLPARLIGNRKGESSAVELLLLKKLSANVWETLAKPGRKLRLGDRAFFGGGKIGAEVIGVTDSGERIVRFNYDGAFEDALNSFGETPLPPYITEKLLDKNRYQTIYAKNDGSAAAPTAGLHFTAETLEKISADGVYIARLTLHVGLGTFRPVKALDITKHKMHSEYYEIDGANAAMINSARENGGRVVAVGTTSLRALESAADARGRVSETSGETDIFIYPGYSFKITDALITNFHLPGSTLLMLVCALAGRKETLRAYDEAVALQYRFFSFGDAMLIL
jgi:S-adenosylmethionine:tRNA ribosyltransferase-isomerase